MIRFLADEDFDNRIVRGVLRRLPYLDLIRVQDTEVASGDDAAVLEWAATEGRVLLSHDVNTMTHFFAERVNQQKPCAGIIFASQSLPIGIAINNLVQIAVYSLDDEYQSRIVFLPLR